MDEIKILNMIYEHDKYLIIKILNNVLIRDSDVHIKLIFNELNKISKEIRIKCLENNSKITYDHCLTNFKNINNINNESEEEYYSSLFSQLLSLLEGSRESILLFITEN